MNSSRLRKQSFGKRQKESQIQEVDHLITALKGTEDNAASQTLKDSYPQRAEEPLPKIIGQLVNYLEVTQRIYQQLNAENVGVTDRLYTQ